MKKLLFLFVFLSGLNVVAQKSVLLRANYAKGDVFVVQQDISQDMGVQGGLDIKMSMEMKVNEVIGDTIKTESQIKKINMNMLQAGQVMSFDSTMKEENLDQMGKMMKQQIDPMLKATIYSTLTKKGEVTNIKVEPMTPAMSQFVNQKQSIKYPEEKVSVGSTWSDENDMQGAATKMIFTVSKIENGKVYVNVSGNVTGAVQGVVKGNLEIDIATGVQDVANIEVAMGEEGAQTVVKTKSSTTKL
ncbi:hypothetical protein [uncultured Polaribacter sp.]|uniref:hypothetical protein n=1 Tax=uncultured Polaribacter sp. TaxID=174711 RepID=UPI0026383B64|nr:hypothetical protein [uncultured Polaribacter sp.]